MAKKNTKEKIFDSSIDLFSQYGYTNTSIRQIAKEVGIKESSIYNHYQSKEAILESILNYYISEMLKEEAPIMQSNDNLDLGFEYFYKQGSDRFLSKLSEERMMKITRIFLVGSYHNEKMKAFVKEGIIDYAIKGWEELFNLMKEKEIIRKDANSKQLAESFYSYGIFLLYEHFIFNYPEDDEKFLKDFERRTTDHMKIIFNSVKINNEESKIDNNKNNPSSNHDKENKELETEIMRLEEEKDYLKVENLVRDAFWNIYRPGAYEHLIVHNLREDPSLIKDLAYIIEEDDEIIGHINYSKGKLNLYKKNNQGMEKINDWNEEAVVLGPIAINPKYQNQGYGFRLIKHTLRLAKNKNIPYVFVIGDENYYNRFGFESASKYNLFLEGTDTSGENPFFMIKVFKNTFEDTDYERGIFYNPKVFNVTPEDVDKFDENFEYKEKKVQEGQLE